MTSRERILAALDRRQPDRLPVCETDIWPETIERWRAEGLPRDVDLNEHFGLDPIACINDLFDPSLGLPARPIEQTSEYRVYVDSYGKTVKELLAGNNPPATLAPGIRDQADWERVKPALTPAAEKFNDPTAETWYRLALARDYFLAITPAEPMWFVLHLTMGFEHGLRALSKQRELVADMIATYTDYVLAMLAMTHARGYRFDALWFWSDLCYRNGMLFSPKAARELVLPHWQRLGRFAHEHDMRCRPTAATAGRGRRRCDPSTRGPGRKRRARSQATLRRPAVSDRQHQRRRGGHERPRADRARGRRKGPRGRRRRGIHL